MSKETQTEPNLDPPDWEAFRRQSHLALDAAIDHLKGLRDEKVWQQTPPAVRDQFAAPLPRQGDALANVLDEFDATIRPYVNGNIHPMFFGWVQGGGTPVGMLAEMLAAGLNANCGGRNHVALDVERQIALWMAELFGFPRSASGIFVTGTSAANFLAMLIARDSALGHGVRATGLRANAAQLVAYTSAQVHGCVAQAAEISGIGGQNLRLIPVDDRGAVRVDLLARAIAEDRTKGLRPFMVVGTAGTVNTGAIDELDALADLCAREKLWFHIDAAFGAFCALSPALKPLIKGLERADSLAFDFHKWPQVPYDAGFLLVRDAEAHRQTFSNPVAYLQRAPAGLAAGDVWPTDLSPDLSRGFRALKTWFTFRVFGADKIGECVAHMCELARHLESRLRQSAAYEVVAPVALNIVCFSLKGSSDGNVNQAIAIDLQEAGIAAPSTTILSGKTVLRAAIVNHRTTRADIDRFVDALHSAAVRYGANQ
jgi:glutamate/tyrosine decarboxylase-like PLP-dependent enzyme